MLAAEFRARQLTTPVRDHLVDIHVELSAATSHPHMQRKHVLMFATKDLVTNARDQHVSLIR
jgi:hypothetical protein